MEKQTSDHEKALEMAQERKRQLVEKMQKRNAWSPLRQIIDECIERARPVSETVELPDNGTN
ncbi:MAG: hypothetical protein QG549_583 [Patescibacteria group bacterium]|nr:hypothetical protein [Patescibacteria group bacterium]